MLTLRTLGQLGVFHPTGAPAHGAPAQRKPLGLLALLAVHQEGLTRERLAAYLWPDLDENRSRQALRQTLYALRRDLATPDLFVDGTAIRLNPEVIGTDLSEFAEAEHRGDWRRVVELRHGPFLDGYYLDEADEFERWADRERARLEDRFRNAVRALATEAEKAGDLEAAIGWWKRQVDADPLDGRAVAGLMHALEASGAPGLALESARSYETRLLDELGAGADPGVLQLASEIRRRMHSAAVPRSSVPDTPAAAGALPAPTPPTAQEAGPVLARPTQGRGRARWVTRKVAAAAAITALLGLVAGRITLPGEGTSTVSARAVAVMPLEETSTDNEGDRIGAAVAEELARLLGHAGALRVLGPGTTAAYRDSANRLELLSSELRMGSALEGTIDRIGEQVELTLRLTSAPGGEELWAFHNLGPLDELAPMLGTVSHTLAMRLQGKLSRSESRLFSRRPTTVPAAYYHFLRATTLDNGNRLENEAGIRILRQALAADSTFALAYATLARRYLFNGFLVSPVYLDSGLVAAHRALEFDPELSLAHFALGDLLVLQGKPVTARFKYLKALELNPNELGAMADLSDADALTGRLDESLYWGLRAVSLDPTSASLHAHAAVPICHMAADHAAARWLAEGERRWPRHQRHQHLLMRQELVTGQAPAAVARARRTAALDPADEESLVALAGVAFLAGASDAESLVTARYRRAPDARPYGPAVEGPRTQLAHLRLQRGDTAAAYSLADTALTRAVRDFERGGEDPLPAVEVAALHALRGRSQEAVGWLRRAHQIGWKDYRYAKLDPILAPLRQLPEFRELMARMEDETAGMRERAMRTSPSVFAVQAALGR
jgi:DNA-binding SARP family transcriptional activator/TolB-like protein